MRRAPKKFTDETQTEIRQEWVDWYNERQEGAQEEIQDQLVGLGIDPMIYWPEDYDRRLPDDGAWVIVVEEPCTEIKQTFTIPTPSLWYAKPALGGARREVHGFGKGVFTPPVYKVTIQTPAGTLWLYPHEYVVCKDPVPLITDPECTIHSLGGQPPIDEETLFYLQSRGISREDAAMLLLDQLDMSTWGWVEFPEYARQAYEGVGRRMNFKVDSLTVNGRKVG